MQGTIPSSVLGCRNTNRFWEKINRKSAFLFSFVLNDNTAFFFNQKWTLGIWWQVVHPSWQHWVFFSWYSQIKVWILLYLRKFAKQFNYKGKQNLECTRTILGSSLASRFGGFEAKLIRETLYPLIIFLYFFQTHNSILTHVLQNTRSHAHVYMYMYAMHTV